MLFSDVFNDLRAFTVHFERYNFSVDLLLIRLHLF